MKFLLAQAILLPSASITDHLAASLSLPVSSSVTAVEPEWDDDENLYWYEHQYDILEPVEKITDQDLAFQEFCLGGRKSLKFGFGGLYVY